jgi:hypothetical protein
VAPDEGNFFYLNYKLLVELDSHMLWVWDAMNTWHGTTVNRIIVDNPTSWKRMACNRKNIKEGQTITVQTTSADIQRAAQRTLSVGN